MKTEVQAASLLLQLPDPCLLEVLRCCVDDPRSLFSAARAHSRLQQAAVLAISSIRAMVPQQQQASSVVLYLTNHGQHISNLHIDGGSYCGHVHLHQLPHTKLQGTSSLSFNGLHLQLQPRGGFQGVVGAGVPLKQLQIHRCKLLDRTEGLVATLALLPELQHPSLVWTSSGTSGFVGLPISTLQALQQLTYLELVGGRLQDKTGMRDLKSLIHLQDLRLDNGNAEDLPASMFSGLQRLTCLTLNASSNSRVEAGVLEGKTQLQHLELVHCNIAYGRAGIIELLSHLRHMQQLTYLDLRATLRGCETAPAPAYSSVTACSKLQHLDISVCTLPEGVWQQLFPADRKLPLLQVLVLPASDNRIGGAGTLQGNRLVTCCPGLRSLKMEFVECSTELMAPLTGLSSLSKLHLLPVDDVQEGLSTVCELTGLRWLDLSYCSEAEGLRLQLAHLKQLTHLEYRHRSRGDFDSLSFQVSPQMLGT
jgi:hypothetical protein